MKKVILACMLVMSALGAAAKDVLRQDTTVYIWKVDESNARFLSAEPVYFHTLTLQAGYAMYKAENAKYGYDFALDYNFYPTRNLFIIGTYFYSFSNNRNKYRETDHILHGEIQSHALMAGLGYDMLKRNGHRIYAGLGLGASYQSFRRDVVVTEFPFKDEEKFSEKWGFIYMVNGGYSYSFLPNLEVGLNWAGYFFPEYWANSINLRIGYKF